MKTLFFSLLLLPIGLFAQQNLTGMVIDEQGKPLDAATVTLSQHGKVVTSQLAEMGKFTLTNLNQSPYDLAVSLLGYRSALRTVTMPTDSLQITLQNEDLQLNEVTVVFKKPTIERQTDRVIFNVANSIMASGGTAWDALNKAPGVQTTNEGGVKANNKQVTVYMDGKPVRLSGDDLAAYLQSIPADNISKLEVMPNPSSSYEAQGGAVINIVSKKPKTDGFSASLSGAYTRGLLNRYTGNGIVNYRKGKLNLFGSYSYSDRGIQRDLTMFTIYQTPTSYAYWNLNRISVIKSKVSNYTAGADYNLTDNQVIGVLITANNAVNPGYSRAVTTIYNNHNISPDSVLSTLGSSYNRVNQYSFNVNYKVKLDSLGSRRSRNGRPGKSLNVDLDYAPYGKDNVQNLNNLMQLPDGRLTSAPQRSTTPSTQTIRIWSGKVDYGYKLGKIWTMESGLKSTSTVSENQFDFYNILDAGSVLDPSKSDRFQYTEHTAAGYTNLAGTLGKWTVKGGLRAELTRTKGFSRSLDSINVKKYLRIFPTVFVTYKASEAGEFGVTYSKRIERPDYRQLNPARNYLSTYNYASGNPFLRPAIINHVQLSYTLYQDYTFAAVYTRTDDLATNVTVQNNDTKTFYDTQQNIGRINDIGAELSAAHHVASWWSINNTAQGYFRSQSSSQPGNSYNSQQVYFYLRTDHAFTFADGLKAEFSAWYTSAMQEGALSLKRIYDISVGISKPVFNNQGTIRLSASDIFLGNPYGITIQNQRQNNGLYQKNDTRTFTVSFSYKLGKSVAAARKRTTASEEERKRAN